MKNECRYKQTCIEKEMYSCQLCFEETECGLKKVLDKSANKMKFLVTGSRGLIGNSVVKRLRKDGHKVNAFDKGDRLPTVSVDMIIHCAANCIIRDIVKDPELAKDNINITSDVLEYARTNDVKKIIMFSSSRVVHKDKHNPYIASKRFCEELTKAYKKCYDIDYIIIRPETVWGINENNVRVMRNWIDKVKKNKDVIVFGDENKKLSPLFNKFRTIRSGDKMSIYQRE